MTRASALLALSVFFLLEAPAYGNNKAACIEALDRAQVSRAARKLLDARASYVSCSHESCPLALRDDCSKGLRDVDDALPSIVLSATLEGRDVTDAEVSLDGKTVANDGRSIAVDPGAHVARFVRRGSGPVETTVVAREGEKNRLVTGTFVLPSRSNLGSVAAARTGETEPTRVPWVPIGFAAGGLLSLGASLMLHVGMVERADELHRTCHGACPQFERDALSDQLVLRNTSFAIGIGAIVVSAVTYIASTAGAQERRRPVR